MTDSTLKRILLASDLSDASSRAAFRAVQWARQSGATLEAVHVTPYVMPPVDSYEDVDQARLEEALHREAHQGLARQLAEAGDESAELCVLTGPTVPTLLDHLNASGSQVTVVGAHGQRPLRDRLLGSTADRLVRRGHQPTVVVRRVPEGPYQRVLVAVDFSEASARALRLALDWFGAEHLTVLHILDLSARDSLRAAGFDPALLERYEDDLENRANIDLEAFVAEAGTSAEALAGCAVVAGEPGQGVLDAATSAATDLVVIGSHGRNRLADVLLGGVAMAVLYHAECDVLVV